MLRQVGVPLEPAPEVGVWRERERGSPLQEHAPGTRDGRAPATAGAGAGAGTADRRVPGPCPGTRHLICYLTEDEWGGWSDGLSSGGEGRLRLNQLVREKNQREKKKTPRQDGR